MRSRSDDGSRRSLQRRLILSFGALAVGMAGVVFAFSAINDGPDKGGAPAVLRAGFRWNEEVWGSLFSRSRLSPPVTAPSPGTQSRFNGDLGLESQIPPNYRLVVDMGDGRSTELSPAALRALPQTEVSTRFKCIEGWSIPVQYAGVRFSDFMDAMGVGKKADGTYYRYVGLETPDGEYYVSIDMESMLHAQTVLADRENGAPLTYAEGAPLRLMIPIKYGIKSLKRVGRIIFSDRMLPDYWAERGYDWYSGL